MAFNSTLYWENRYKKCGNSGKGSYGILAEYKANIINDFITQYGVESVIDYGVGDGNQLKFLNVKNYIGLDISSTIIEKCKNLFKGDITKTFYLTSDFMAASSNNVTAELVLSCDVLYHLIEPPIYEEYMINLFNMSNKYVIIYAANIEKQDAKHVKKRIFTVYIEKNFPAWKLMKIKLNPYKGKNTDSDFYIYFKLNLN